MPLDPANPYGSFYDDRSLRSSAAGMSGDLGVDPALAALVGNSSGGYFPTSAEFFNQKMQSVRNNQFMMDRVRNDPRAAGITDYVMNSAFGNNQQRIDNFYKSIGGRDNALGMAGSLANMPGISGFLGGDIRSIAMGSLAVAGGGGRINNQAAYGSGLAQERIARGVHDSVMNGFFTRNGANRLEMTSGLNMDQIGGIMTMAGSQGAFSGLNLGSVDGTGGSLHTALNPDATGKIKEFIKTASKSMAALIDVFGSQDINTLSKLATKITGLDLSSTRNANAMLDRLNSLKSTAAAMGVSAETAFRGVMGGSNFAQSALGFSEAGGGALSSLLYGGSMQMARYMSQDPGYFMQKHSAADYHAARETDRGGMLRDSRGARAALAEYAEQSGLVSGAGADALRAAASGMTLGKQDKFDLLYNHLTGGSASNAILSLRGGQNIWENLLDPEHQASAISALDSQHSIRQRDIFKRSASVMLNNRTGGNLLGEMAATFDDQTLNGMALAADAQGATIDSVADVALTDTGLGLNKEQARAHAQKMMAFRSAMGRNATGAMRFAMPGLRGDMRTMGFITDSMRGQMARTSNEAAITVMDAETERKLSGGPAAMQSLLQSLSPDNPTSQFGMLYLHKSKDVYGNFDQGANAAAIYLSGYTTGPDGLLDKASQDRFVSTLGYLPKEVRDRMQIKDQWLNISGEGRLTDSERSLRIQKAFGIFQNNMLSPEAKQRALLGFNVLQGANGRVALGKTAVLNEQSALTSGTLVADIIGDSLHDTMPDGSPGTRTRYFKSLAMLYGRGKALSGTGKGKFAYRKGDLARLHNAFTADLAMELSPEAAKRIALADSEIASEAVEKLGSRKAFYEQSEKFAEARGDGGAANDFKERVAKIVNQMNAFESGMNVKPARLSGSTITGTAVQQGGTWNITLHNDPNNTKSGK